MTPDALLFQLNGKRIFENLIARLTLLARNTRRLLSTQHLQWQMLWLVLLALGAGVLPLWIRGLELGNRANLPLSPAFVLLWTIGGLCALGAAWKAKYHRMASLIMLGGAGLCTCITFLWFSAPDLALTQLVVEVVTTVLILLGLRWLPKRDKSLRIPALSTELAARARRLRDLLIALAAGGSVGWLAFAMMSRPFPESTSTFFLERALSEGGGTNVVNVMLVDFRGFDTFGEIVVLGIVALTVYALLRRFRPARETMDIPEQQRYIPGDLQTDLINPRNAGIRSWLPDGASGTGSLAAAFATLVAIYLFLRGHDEPGGGFVAGWCSPSHSCCNTSSLARNGWKRTCRCSAPLDWFRIAVRHHDGHRLHRGGLPLHDQPHFPLQSALDWVRSTLPALLFLT